MRRQPPQYRSLPSSYQQYVWRLCAVVALLVVAIIIDACGSTEKDYKYFHWFVDGIPEPGSIEDTSGQTHTSSFLAGGTQQIPPGTTYYSHQPWADENCHACHQGVSQFSMPTRDDSQICMQCHEEVVDEYRYMHGAVVSVACLWCHAPHLSQYKHLLRSKSPDICLQCHTTEDGSLVAEEEHTDLTRDCLECHFGHGSAQPGFLKPVSIPDVPKGSDLPGPPAPSEDQPKAGSADNIDKVVSPSAEDSALRPDSGIGKPTKENP